MRRVTSPEVDPARLSAIAKAMYAGGPVILRTLQRWRPYICPFEKLVGQVEVGSTVLDVGCGAGLLLSLLAGLGCRFEGVGFDVSHSAIDLAKVMAKRAAVTMPQANLSFEQVGTESEWPLGLFDVVFLIDVLHHVPPSRQRRFLQCAMAKVRANGKLVYKDMCLRPWWKAQANRLHDLVVARERINYVPVTTVEEWARSEGMETILKEDLSRLWYGHELRVMERTGVGSGEKRDGEQGGRGRVCFPGEMPGAERF